MFTQPKTKGLDLKYFAIHRPVIREVLNFNLNPIIYTDKIKKIQLDLELKVRTYQENLNEDEYILNQSEIDVIMISCCRMLRWIGRHPAHAWKKPTRHLLDEILNNRYVEPETEDYKKVYDIFDPFSRF